jgi:hypothetical protein
LKLHPQPGNRNRFESSDSWAIFPAGSPPGFSKFTVWLSAKTTYIRASVMKIFFAGFVSAVALFLGSCAEQPLLSNEEYDATHGPAPFSPDYSSVLPQPNTRPSGSGY